MGWKMIVGVTTHKNQLGQLCLILGIYFIWNLLFNSRKRIESEKRLHFSIYLIILPTIGWLFYRADSATSLTCMFVALCLFLVSRLPAMVKKPSIIFIFGLFMVSVFVVLEATLGLSKLIIVNILGRDSSLTTRVPMWYGLIKMAGNPVVGVGYESFWLGHRLEVLWQAYGTLHQAHNGYLEIFLNLGWIGLALLGVVIATRYRTVFCAWRRHTPMGNLWLAYFLVGLVFNFTEAAFFRMQRPVWLFFLFAIVSVPAASRRQSVASAPSLLHLAGSLDRKRGQAGERPVSQARVEEQLARVGQDEDNDDRQHCLKDQTAHGGFCPRIGVGEPAEQSMSASGRVGEAAARKRHAVGGPEGGDHQRQGQDPCRPSAAEGALHGHNGRGSFCAGDLAR